MLRNKDRPIKNTLEVFKRLRIEKNLLSKKQKNFLESKGYLIIKPTNFMKKNLKKLSLAAKKLIEKEGKRGGWEGKEKYYKYKNKKEKPCLGSTRRFHFVDFGSALFVKKTIFNENT